MSHDDPLTDLDIELSAYLDGELDDARARALERRIEAEPALAARLAQLRAADAQWRHALAALDDKPLPASLEALLARADEAPENVVPMRAPALPVSRSAWAAAWPVAIAAGLALVVGFVAARLATPGGGDGIERLVGPVAPASPLYAVLEHQPSGAVAEIDGETLAAPVQSFTIRGGGYCRELQIHEPLGSARALACLDRGGWQVRVAEFTPAEPGDGYTTATGETSVVGIVARQRMHGEPLDAQAEAELLGRWREAAAR